MSLLSDLLRAARLGGVGLSLRQVKHASGEKRDEALQRVVSRMATLKGLPQKFGQILSLRELGDGDGAYRELTESEAHAEPFEKVERWLRDAYGGPLDELFASIEPEGIAASLGQVHRAKLLDGRSVALKVQYPGVRDAVQSDLKAIGLLAGAVTSRHEGFNLESYRAELRESLNRELDYECEERTLSRFSERLASSPDVAVPKPESTLCRPTVLVMEWLEGRSIDSFAELAHSQRVRLAQCLLRFFLRSWLQWGEVHGDPHSGNFRILETAGEVKLGVLDFGCTKILTQAERTALLFLLTKGRDVTPHDALRAYTLLGFSEALLVRMQDSLPAVTEALLKPFFAEGPFDVTNWSISDEISEALGEERWNFRFAGPATIILFVRALSGLIQYLRAFEVQLNWGIELRRVLDEIGDISPELPDGSGASFEDRALHIRVTERGITRVKLTFPGESVRSLEQMMPPDVREKLVEREISVSDIVEKTVARNFPDGELFSLRDGEKEFRIWLGQ